MKYKLNLPQSWQQILDKDFAKEDLIILFEKVEKEYETYPCYPPIHRIFFALETINPEDVKVIILGQDPYHGEGQANGLAFSVNPGVKIPPSLRNIFKEIKGEFGFDIPTSGDLTNWSRQGVLLLNATLTVRQGSPNSHEALGWSKLTDAIITTLNVHFESLVFVLWGNFAAQKNALITNESHLVLISQHPSPLSAHRGFFGNNHFTKVNQFLIEKGKPIINWELSHQMNIPYN
jgi:uracil-DNA glycosylase